MSGADASKDRPGPRVVLVTQRVDVHPERGERREYVTSAPVAATAAVGDLGLAWVKGQHVVGFERAPV